MRISTQCSNIKRVLGQEGYLRLEQDYERQMGGKLIEGQTIVIWILKEEKIKIKSKVWLGLVKTNAKEYLRQGLSRGWLKLSISIKNPGFKVWESEGLDDLYPEEVVLALKRKNEQQESTKKWMGPLVELFTPLNQMHPGLTEYAIVGGFKTDMARYVLLSDQLEPYNSNNWHVYCVGEPGILVNAMQICDMAMQKIFMKTKNGDKINWRGIEGNKVEESEFLHWIGVSKKWKACFSANESKEIPVGIKKFKLGEKAGSQEKSALDVEALFKSLGLN